MAALYADEDFPLEVVEGLRRRGHDVLTAREAGQADSSIPDAAVLAFATAEGRAVLTMNRWDFVRLHSDRPDHGGIVACTPDTDTAGQVGRIDGAVRGVSLLAGVLIRVNRPS